MLKPYSIAQLKAIAGQPCLFVCHEACGQGGLVIEERAEAGERRTEANILTIIEIIVKSYREMAACTITGEGEMVARIVEGVVMYQQTHGHTSFQFEFVVQLQASADVEQCVDIKKRLVEVLKRSVAAIMD